MEFLELFNAYNDNYKEKTSFAKEQIKKKYEGSSLKICGPLEDIWSYFFVISYYFEISSEYLREINISFYFSCSFEGLNNFDPGSFNKKDIIEADVIIESIDIHEHSFRDNPYISFHCRCSRISKITTCWINQEYLGITTAVKFNRFS